MKIQWNTCPVLDTHIVQDFTTPSAYQSAENFDIDILEENPCTLFTGGELICVEWKGMPGSTLLLSRKTGHVKRHHT